MFQFGISKKSYSAVPQKAERVILTSGGKTGKQRYIERLICEKI